MLSRCCNWSLHNRRNRSLVATGWRSAERRQVYKYLLGPSSCRARNTVLHVSTDSLQLRWNRMDGWRRVCQVNVHPRISPEICNASKEVTAAMSRPFTLLTSYVCALLKAVGFHERHLFMLDCCSLNGNNYPLQGLQYKMRDKPFCHAEFRSGPYYFFKKY